MAEFVLSYPFSIDAKNRRFEVVSSDTDTYKAQQIKGFLRTLTGERPLMPLFGIDEPTFNTFDTGQFYENFINFYPPASIEVKQITLTDGDGALRSVVVEFS